MPLDLRQALGLGAKYIAEQRLRNDMVEMLRELEWTAYDAAPRNYNSCPTCGRQESDGHRPSCALGKLLDRIGR